MSLVIGVDVGGTFTDFFVCDPERGFVLTQKTPSTPADPAEAILHGLDAMAPKLAAAGVDLAATTRFAHGTTVATNTLIQRRGSEVALATTSGFRDLLEIGRQVRPHVYDLQTDAPPPLAPRERRFEVLERIGPAGETITELTEAAVAAVVEQVAAAADPAGERPVEAVAVCLLFSFLAPEHEARVGAALRARLPGLSVSLSSEVQPEFREYERMSTAVLNAYLQPRLSRYLDRLGREVAARAPRARIGINQSSGGLMSIDQAARFPVRTALSGPAAGVVGAIDAARRSGCADLITLDMGGTSTDVCLIRGGEAEMTFGRDVAGFPVRLPAIDIHTVGAGGGSIAAFAADGLLKVGPASAGSDPGPAAYLRGGEAATVTDANLVLGRLPERIAGGDMRLDRAAAAAALAPIAARLGVGVEAAALGVLRIVNANMMGAIRAVSVERGHDPRAFALMPFGGAGGLHAADLADEIGMREILAPRSPGILCAQGLLVADLAESFVATCRQPLGGDLAGLRAAHAGLVDQALAWADAEGVAPADRSTRTVLDMRYVGQNYELPVTLGAALSEAGDDRALTERLTALFFAAHSRAYGHHDPDAPVEIVNLRLTALGATPDLEPPPPQGSGRSEPIGERPIWFDAAAPVVATVWRRDDLTAGQEIAGPAVVEQLDATTLAPPGWRIRVDAALNLVMTRAPA